MARAFKLVLLLQVSIVPTYACLEPVQELVVLPPQPPEPTFAEFPTLSGPSFTIAVPNPNALAFVNGPEPGTKDLLTVRHDEVVLFAGQRGGGLDATPVSLHDGGFGANYLTAAASSSKGAVQLAVLDYNRSTVTILSRSVMGGWDFRGLLPTNPGAGGRRIRAGDVDTDGEDDHVLIVGGQLMSSRHQNDGGLTFQSINDDVNGPSDLAIADFDSDGNADIALAIEGDARFTVLMGRGGGLFATARQISLMKLGASSIAALDVDGDSKLDLVLGTNDPQGVLYFHGNGDGTFQEPVATSGFQALELVKGNFDGTGATQLAAIDRANNRIVILNWSSGRFVVRGQHRVVGPGGLAVADIDSDGFDDLAVGCLTQKAVNVFLGTSR